MVLSQAAKYALRAAVHLAHTPQEQAMSRTMADELGVPAQYLAKVLQDLARAGVLQSTRGRGGGFRLARPANDIHLLEVVEALDGPRFAEEGCVLDLPECSEEDPCPLHSQWKEIKASLLKTLGETTLDDVARRTAPGGASD